LPDGLLQRAHDIRVKRRRGKELAEAEDERLALERISGVLRNVPNTCSFIRIPQGSLLVMPESVYVEGNPQEFESFQAGSKAIEELAQQFMNAAVKAQTP